jgi:hypothetical protein
MSFTSIILSACLLCASGEAAPVPPETLTVHINVFFDDSITSQAIKAAAMDEAAAIWRKYGVQLQFTEPAANAALSLDVIVERTARRLKHDGEPAVLGHTLVSTDKTEQAPLRISFDAVTALLDNQRGVTQLIHDYSLAAALGRVVAHEIGHVLLGSPAYHDADGLMRTTFFPDDLARPERSRFLLAQHSVMRLRERIAELTETLSTGSDASRPNSWIGELPLECDWDPMGGDRSPKQGGAR